MSMGSMGWDARGRVADALPSDTPKPEAMPYPHDAESP